MGWYAQPDTLCIGEAAGVANKTGHKLGNVGWLQAYRDAYERIAGEGAKEYIQRLDEELAIRKKATQ